MNVQEIVFKCDNAEKIIIKLQEPVAKTHCCSNTLIIFQKDDKDFILENEMFSLTIPDFSVFLEEALANELILDKSLRKNIGYQYAQYVFFAYDRNILEKFGLVFDENNDWVGEKYLVWGYDLALWMYNDENGAIILEFTSMYRGGYFDSEDDAAYKVYEQFLKNYKSYFTFTISRKTAQQWLDQANALLKQIDENVKRLIADDKFYENDESSSRI